MLFAGLSIRVIAVPYEPTEGGSSLGLGPCPGIEINVTKEAKLVLLNYL